MGKKKDLNIGKENDIAEFTIPKQVGELYKNFQPTFIYSKKCMIPLNVQQRKKQQAVCFEFWGKYSDRCKTGMERALQIYKATIQSFAFLNYLILVK